MSEHDYTEIFERLNCIERNTAATTEQLRSLGHNQAVMSQYLTGNGDYKRGLMHRVDRLEFSSTFSKKVFWLVVGAIVSAAAFYVKELI